MYNVVGVGCRRCAETEKLGHLTVTGNKRNKMHNEVSVMLGFKADSGGKAVNIGNRKCWIHSIPPLLMIAWLEGQEEPLIRMEL